MKALAKELAGLDEDGIAAVTAAYKAMVVANGVIAGSACP